MKKIVLPVFILLYAAVSYAQPGLLRKEADKQGVVIFAEFRTDSVPESMSESKQLLKQLLDAEQYDELTVTDSKTDELGFTHQYYSQYYKGVRVAYGNYAVHSKGGVVSTASGTFQRTWSCPWKDLCRSQKLDDGNNK